MSPLRKEQKQMAFLIVMLAFGGLYATYQFVLVPAKEQYAKSREERNRIFSDLERAEIAIAGKDKIRIELDETANELLRCRDEYIAPLGTPLTWATEYCYSLARKVGVTLDSVDEERVGSVPWASASSQRVFVPYAVRIRTQCSFYEFIHLLDAIEKSNPYVCVSDINITSQDKDKLRHRVSCIVQWPTWKDSKGLEKIHLLEEKPADNEQAMEDGFDAAGSPGRRVPRGTSFKG